MFFSTIYILQSNITIYMSLLRCGHILPVEEFNPQIRTKFKEYTRDIVLKKPVLSRSSIYLRDIFVIYFF